MMVILSALVVVAKVLLSILAILALFALLLLVLPIKARVSGLARAQGDFEAFLDGQGPLAIGRAAGAAVELIWDVAASARVFGGILGVDYDTGRKLDVYVLGMRFPVNLKGRSKVVLVAKPGDKQGTGEAREVTKGHGLLRFQDAKRWLAPEVRRQALVTIRYLFRSLGAQGQVGVECGLPDPGVTGMAYASFLAWSGVSRERWLTFTPNFTENVVSIETDGRIRLVAAQSAWIIGRFLLSRDIRPLWRKKRAGESKKAPILGAHTTG